MGAMYFILNSRLREKRLIKNTFPMSPGFMMMKNLPEKKVKDACYVSCFQYSEAFRSENFNFV